MRVNVQTNAEQLGRAMSAIFHEQVPFAVARAVRQTALDVQEAQREHQAQAFTIRRKTFMSRAVKIRDWPTKQDPTAIVRIEPPGGPERAQLLIEHEEGGRRGPPGTQHTPGKPARKIEREARPSPTQIAPKRLRPKQLGLKVVSSGGPEGVEVAHGKLGTFSLKWPSGAGLILQRTSRGRARVLWALAPGGVNLTARLGFHETATRVIGERWVQNMGDAWDQAIRTAK
jgi:hypothetical protein